MVLLDIEGTTTPIDFVHKTLFPFARERMTAFVAENFFALAEEIKNLKIEHREDYTEKFYTKDFNENFPASVADYLKFLIDEDRKSTALKSVQGKIWQQGYESGELKSIVFDDVPRAFERWNEKGKTIAVYSSGSVLSQKLIFKYSNHGDLTRFIENYFDTNVGPKRASESYRNIQEKLTIKAEEILFVSDVTEELDAAKKAGFQTALMIRAGNAPVKNKDKYKTIDNFSEV